MALVEAAARAGADVVKFQSFRAEKLATAVAAKAAYQQATTGDGESQLEMLRALELSELDELRIAETCTSANITYMSTPFDVESATHLVSKIGILNSEGWLGRFDQCTFVATSGAVSFADYSVDRNGDISGN